MRTLKECILEKLKVSSNNYVNITYQEYYDLLDEYCKTNNEKFLDLNRVFNFDDILLPRYEFNKNRVINTIRAGYPGDPEIIIKTRDSVSEKPFFYRGHVSDSPDKEVDFMEDEYIEATVKYMKEHIK